MNDYNNENHTPPAQAPAKVKGGEMPAGMMQLFQMAQNKPRILSQFNQKALAMATDDKDVAASCFYKLVRKKKNTDGSMERVIIEGPSIRLAEIVVNCWGNLWISSTILGEEGGSIVAEARVCDLEALNMISMESRRRITGRNGNRFSDDMVIMTANAASALALRNAVFKAVPFTYVKKIYEQCKRVAVGDAKSMVERRAGMVSAFAKMGISQDRLLAYLEKESMEEILLPEIEEMVGLFSAIKDGETSIDEVFPEPKSAAAPKPPAAEPKAPPEAAAPVSTPTPPKPTQEPEVGQKAAPAPPPAKESPAPATEPAHKPENSAETRKKLQQSYNAMYAKAKTAHGKQVTEEALERAGIPPNLFPSKLTEEQLQDGIGAFQALISVPKGEAE